MKILRRKIKVAPNVTVSSVWSVPDGYVAAKGSAIIIAHGAGNDMTSAFITYMHKALAVRGIMTVKFNFPYKERGGKAPDRPPLLEATWRAVIAHVRADPALAPKRLFLSGKSMGGRIASHVAAAGEPCAGLVFFGYPLHSAVKPEQLRAAHLADVRCPMLFLQGSRDALCNLDALKTVLKRIKRSPSKLHVVEGGDHSFAVPKAQGRSEQDVWDELVTQVVDWISAIR